ncbi:MAG: Hsp20/alpha crystallin family protein [Deltaproteobacteria bacterium]|nr:Hsp20/alpha crystallin family protein [Deltaproteobacteria bacterium]MCB9785766.1 Hsp20/alpha crystallin family protein [Deltaproteobacteria bacterium]
MFMPWNDFDRTLAVVDAMRRRMDRAFSDLAVSDVTRSGDTAQASLHDVGTELVLSVDVPGYKEDDLDLSVHRDVLTLKGQRQLEAPEGYRAHRVERRSQTFARSFKLSAPVDAEKTQAKLQNGVLTVRMTKSAEAQPRRISVKA